MGWIYSTVSVRSNKRVEPIIYNSCWLNQECAIECMYSLRLSVIVRGYSPDKNIGSQKTDTTPQPQPGCKVDEGHTIRDQKKTVEDGPSQFSPNKPTGLFHVHHHRHPSTHPSGSSCSVDPSPPDQAYHPHHHPDHLPSSASS